MTAAKTIACVWAGHKYSISYVRRLKAMVDRCAPGSRFLCLTDRNEVLPDGVERVNVASYGLPTWWPKMALFQSELRGYGRCVFFDLDTVLLGDISELFCLDTDFAVCANFTRLAGHETWPCGYGSCVMVFAEGWGDHVWAEFWSKRGQYMRECVRGDQQAIERIYPGADLLQGMMPPQYFLGHRDLEKLRGGPPPQSRVVCFGGSKRPHNSNIPWVQEAWR